MCEGGQREYEEHLERDSKLLTNKKHHWTYENEYDRTRVIQERDYEKCL
jgi:hypothetical protein